MKFKARKSNQLILNVSFFVLYFVIILSSFYIYSNKKRTLQSHYKDSLTSISSTASSSIVSLFNRYKKEIEYWANDKKVISFTENLLSVEDNDKKIKSNHEKIKSFLNPIKTSLGLEGYFIISRSGKNLASSRIENVAVKSLIVSDMKNWLNAVNGNTVFTKLMKSDVLLKNEKGKLVSDRPTMFILTPIKKMNKVIAVMAFRINPSEIYWNVLERGRIGKSGESYAVNKDGFLVSRSRFNHHIEKLKLVNLGESPILNIEVKEPSGKLTKMTKNVLLKKSGSDLEGYLDYRGIKVIGVWNWVEELEVGITSEIDHSEAYEGLYLFKNYLIFFNSLILVLLSISLKLISRRMSRLSKRASVQESRLKSILFNTKGIIYQSHYDQNWRFHYTNQAIVEITGYPIKKFTSKNGMSFYELVCDDNLETIKAEINEAIKNQKPFEVEYEILTSEGERKTVLEKGQGIYNGTICEYIEGFIIDISDKKETEMDLKWQLKSMKCLSLMFEICQRQIEFRDKIKTLLRVIQNSELFDFKEFSGIYLIEEKKTELITSIELEEDSLSLEEIDRNETKYFKIPIFSKDKELIGWIVLEKNHTTRLSEKENNFFLNVSGIVGNLIDTEKLEKEVSVEQKKSIQTSKLAMLGEMAAGVAHEVNNPLAIISSSNKILIKYIDDFEKVQKMSAKIDDSVSRIAKIVKGLKKFGRDSSDIVTQEVSSSNFISEVMSLVAIKSSKDEVPVHEKTKKDINFFCDNVQIQQVIINLINNGIDAVKNEENSWVSVELDSNEEYVKIIVQDSGKGISEEVLEKMFNPFFTTKPVGEGTGLGLSISKSICREHGGDLEYALIDGHTGFVITIPALVKVQAA